jgi:hypothetical protein
MSQAAYRAAAVSFLTDYAASLTDPILAKKLQVYAGRPRSINPPTAFVDALRETIALAGISLMQRTISADVIVLFGLFDSADAAAQKDAFADGFIQWAATRYHEAGANTLIRVASTEDLPAYVNDWMPPDQQRSFYGLQITLEGYAES